MRRVRDRRRRGAYLVELALTLMPMMALLLAILDLAMPIFLRSAFTHAVREGVRYGITYRTVAGKSQTESIRDIVLSQAAGFLKDPADRDKVKVRYYNPDTLVEATGTNRNQGGNIVEVSVEGWNWSWVLPFWRDTAPIGVYAVSSDRLERLPRGTALPSP